MSVVRSKKRSSHYFTAHTYVLEDPRLSMKAKGLWAYCMSRSEGWDFNVAHLETVFTDGKKAIYAAFDELIKFGYCERTQTKNIENGKLLFGKMEYTVLELPKEKEDELKKCFPHSPFRRAEKETLARTNVSNKKEAAAAASKETAAAPVKSLLEEAKEIFEIYSLTKEQADAAWLWLENKQKQGKAKDPMALLVDAIRKGYYKQQQAPLREQALDPIEQLKAKYPDIPGKFEWCSTYCAWQDGAHYKTLNFSENGFIHQFENEMRKRKMWKANDPT